MRAPPITGRGAVGAVRAAPTVAGKNGPKPVTARPQNEKTEFASGRSQVRERPDRATEGQNWWPGTGGQEPG